MRHGLNRSSSARSGRRRLLGSAVVAVLCDPRRPTPWWLAIPIVLAIATPAPAAVWLRDVRSTVTGLGTDTSSTIFAIVEGHRGDSVVAFRSDTGAPAWRRRFGGRIADFAVAPDGGLVVAGTVRADDRSVEDLVVERLDGRSGRRRWRVRGRNGARRDAVQDVAIDPDDRIVVLATTHAEATAEDPARLLVQLLDGQTGSERWRVEEPLPGRHAAARKVAFDEEGAVFVAGSIDAFPKGAMKLSPDGVEMWANHHILGGIRDVAVASDGDLLVVGPGFIVQAYSGRTGALEWWSSAGTTTAAGALGARLLVDPAGPVYAIGIGDDGTAPVIFGGHVFTVVALRPHDGSHIWEFTTGGAGLGADGMALALAPGGRLVAAGNQSTASTCRDAFVVMLDRATGAVVDSVTIDGSYATTSCVEYCIGRSCVDVDDDSVTAVVVDQAGQVTVATSTVERRGRHDYRFRSSVRALGPLSGH